jgi:hypothetical protein
MSKAWDTSKGRKWVVVAFWGEETTVTFCGGEVEANTAYKLADNQGADVFYAPIKRMRIHK